MQMQEAANDQIYEFCLWTVSGHELFAIDAFTTCNESYLDYMFLK